MLPWDCEQAEFEVPAYLAAQLEVGGHADAQQRLYNCLLAAFSVLLFRYSRQDDITVAGVLPGTAQVCNIDWWKTFAW